MDDHWNQEIEDDSASSCGLSLPTANARHHSLAPSDSISLHDEYSHPFNSKLDTYSRSSPSSHFSSSQPYSTIPSFSSRINHHRSSSNGSEISRMSRPDAMNLEALKESKTLRREMDVMKERHAAALLEKDAVIAELRRSYDSIISRIGLSLEGTAVHGPMGLCGDIPVYEHIDHPRLKYWDESDLSVATTKKKLGTGINDTASSSNTWNFLEDEHGRPVSSTVLEHIRKRGRLIFADLVIRNIAPRTWEKAGLTASSYFEFHMVRAFPFLALCSFSWKVNKIATEIYPSWYKNHCKSNMVVAVKVETVVPPAPTSAKRKSVVGHTETAVKKPRQETTTATSTIPVVPPITAASSISSSTSLTATAMPPVNASPPVLAPGPTPVIATTPSLLQQVAIQSVASPRPAMSLFGKPDTTTTKFSVFQNPIANFKSPFFPSRSPQTSSPPSDSIPLPSASSVPVVSAPVSMASSLLLPAAPMPAATPSATLEISSSTSGAVTPLPALDTATPSSAVPIADPMDGISKTATPSGAIPPLPTSMIAPPPSTPHFAPDPMEGISGTPSAPVPPPSTSIMVHPPSTPDFAMLPIVQSETLVSAPVPPVAPSATEVDGAAPATTLPSASTAPAQLPGFSIPQDRPAANVTATDEGKTRKSRKAKKGKGVDAKGRAKNTWIDAFHGTEDEWKMAWMTHPDNSKRTA
ncbi:hypothetical protein BDZ89DRAFT_1164163 [Hymenopellis radicata]|nr:hypothetical protein BDZ89DRAFT_1164163 [Hymenopellis radicata]